MTTSDLVTNAVVEKPDEWPVRTAASFNPFITSGSRGWAKYYADHGDLFMRITNLKRHKIKPDLSDLQHVALPPSEKEGLRTGLRKGDILISITADIGIIGYVDESVPTPAYINQHVACLRLPEDQVSPKFVAYYLASAEPQRRFIENTDVGAKTGINLTTVGRLTFPCPPLAEQEAIAEALSDADALIERLERLIAKKRLIKQGAMQDLLTAKRRLPGFSGEWKPITLFEMADCDKKNFDDGDWIEAEHIAPTGMRLIQTGNVGIGQFINTNKKYIFPESFKKLRCKEVHPGDVLICRLADPPGRACIVPDIGEEKMLTSVDVTIFRPKEALADRKLLTEFMSQSGWFARVDEASGGTTRKRIARSNLGRMPLFMPPIKEQQAMSELFTDMDAEIQALETRLEKARQVKEGMMQNLLTGRIRLL